ncbi:MAG TPA: hypothetical protein VF848_00210 [Steroidobacteraceae bacterium]
MGATKRGRQLAARCLVLAAHGVVDGSLRLRGTRGLGVAKHTAAASY